MPSSDQEKPSSHRDPHVAQPASAPAPPPSVAARGVVLLSAAQFVVAGFGYVLHFVAARALPEADYGRLAVLMSVMNWMNCFLAMSLVKGFEKVVSEDRNRVRAALKVAARWYVPFVVSIAAVFLFCCPLLADLWRDRKLYVLFLMVGGQLPFLAMFFLGKSILTAARWYGSSASLISTCSISRTVIACTLLLIGMGTFGAMLGQVSGAAVAAVVASVLLWRRTKGTSHVEYPPMFNRSMAWTATTLPMSLAWATMLSLDLWLVKRMIEDAKETGIYGAAMVVSRLPGMILLGLANAVFPRVSGALAEGKTDLARSVTTEAYRILILLYAPLCFIVIGCASELVELVFSARYVRAGAILAVLIVAGTFGAMLELTLSLLGAANRPGWRLILVLGILPLKLALCLVLIPPMSTFGAAVAAVVTAVVGAVVGTVLIYRAIRALPPPLSLLRCLCAGGVVGVPSFLWSTPGWMVLVKMTAMGLLYLLLLVVLGELKRKDLRSLTRAFGK